MPKGVAKFRPAVVGKLEAEKDKLTPLSQEMFWKLVEEFAALEEQLAYYQEQLEALATMHPECQRLMTIPGIGPFSATALVAAVSDASAFKNGRQFAAWLGLVPRQHSTGGKERLLGMSKETVVKTPGLSSPCLMEGGEGLLTALGLGFTPHIQGQPCTDLHLCAHAVDVLLPLAIAPVAPLHRMRRRWQQLVIEKRQGLFQRGGKELLERVAHRWEPLEPPPQFGQFGQRGLGPAAPIKQGIDLLH